MIDHSIVLLGERYVIRWMRYQNAFPAYDYLRSLGAEADRVEARFRALATMMAEEGRLPSDIHGHWLKSPFEDIYEFKPSGHRIFGFVNGTDFYITSGAPKRKARAQAGDYLGADNLRKNFFARLTTKNRRKRT